MKAHVYSFIREKNFQPDVKLLALESETCNSLDFLSAGRDGELVSKEAANELLKFLRKFRLC